MKTTVAGGSEGLVNLERNAVRQRVPVLSDQQPPDERITIIGLLHRLQTGGLPRLQLLRMQHLW